GSDPPPVDAIRRARDREMGDPGAVFDAYEQHGFAADERRARVEDGVGPVRPLAGGQDRVARVPDEQLRTEPAELLLHRRHPTANALSGDRCRTTTGSSAASSESWAWWNASVDSAPSFSLIASSPRPSLQPPV